ncbi:hypothetical protein GCM10022419_016020 [Nonomuraea rosea]|uniref:Uncharacterized protein n=1 Tax=Nonomuraea rosea TaxID=638574 RepID=A0ABP6VNL4_9ACTN
MSTCEILFCFDKATHKAQIRDLDFVRVYEICGPHALGRRPLAGTIIGIVSQMAEICTDCDQPAQYLDSEYRDPYCPVHAAELACGGSPIERI